MLLLLMIGRFEAWLEVCAKHRERCERVLFHASLGSWRVRCARPDDKRGYIWRVSLPWVDLSTRTLYTRTVGSRTEMRWGIAGRVFGHALRERAL